MVADDGSTKSLPHLDSVVTRDPATGQLGIILVNLHEEDATACRIRGLSLGDFSSATALTVNGSSVDAFNDVDRPDEVSITESQLAIADISDFAVDCPPHSVTVLNLA